MLLVLEDAHRIDATTLELMTRLTDSIGTARLLAVVAGRPEFVPPWQMRPQATLLTLGRLGRAECAELVSGVAASHGLSAETIAAIVAKSDAFYREQSCPLPTRLRAHQPVCWLGAGQ